MAAPQLSQPQPRPPTGPVTRPTRQRPPTVRSLALAASARADPGADLTARQAQPERQCEPNRQGTVRHSPQYSSRHHAQNRSAARAPIAACPERDLLWRPLEAPGAEHGPLTQPVPDQTSCAVSTCAGRSAPTAGRRPRRTNRRGLGSPKLDTEIEVDDSLGALRRQAIRSTTGKTSRCSPSPILCGRLRVDAPPPRQPDYPAADPMAQ